MHACMAGCERQVGADGGHMHVTRGLEVADCLQRQRSCTVKYLDAFVGGHLITTLAVL